MARPPRAHAAVALALALALGVTACGDDEEPTDTGGTSSSTADDSTGPQEIEYGTEACPEPDGSSERKLEFDDSFEQCIEDGASYTATFATTEGDIVIALDTERTPHVTNSFVALARYHYYDDTLLFRTDTSIGIIQGGAPNTNDPTDPGPGFTLEDEGGEFDDALGTGPFRYGPAQLVMARTAAPDSSGAQFFFTVTERAELLDSTGTYIVFGTVTEGHDVLEAILALHVDDPASGLGGHPSRDVTVETVTITES